MFPSGSQTCPDPVHPALTRIIAGGPCPSWTKGALKEESVPTVPSGLLPPLVQARSLRKWQRNQGKWKLTLCETQCGKNAGCFLSPEFEACPGPGPCPPLSPLVIFLWVPWSSSFVFTSGLLLIYSPDPDLLSFLLPSEHVSTLLSSLLSAWLPVQASSFWTECLGY